MTAPEHLPFRRRLRLAISDPGAVIPRATVRGSDFESVPEWQARAVEAVFAQDWRETESTREAIRSELIRQHLDGECMGRDEQPDEEAIARHWAPRVVHDDEQLDDVSSSDNSNN